MLRAQRGMRIPPAERNLIDRAAQSAGKARTDFILEGARRAAEEHLLDRALMGRQSGGLRRVPQAPRQPGQAQ